MRSEPASLVIMSVYQPKRCQLIATILMVACAVPVISQAQMYELCPAFLPERPLITALPLDTPTVAEADQAEYDREGNVILTGNAQIRRPTEQISGEFLQYQSHPEEISGRGNLWYETPSFLVKAQSAVIEPAREQGRLEDAIYWLVDHHATGKARYVEQLTASRFRLRQATYSTCPVTQRDWELRASRIDLNRDRGRGLARHTTLRLGNVPVLYLPLVSFPIDDRRQTGFLYPSVGNSSSSGFEISTPWYWNIAPHTDATLTPRFISRRGLGLDSEWRYLHRRGYGEVHFNLLPNDRVYGETRWQGQLRHAAQWRHDFSTELLVNRVSDDHYFRDFSNSLEDAATDNIESAFRVRYRVGSWQLGLLAQQYQTVNPLINKPWYPYRIMPRVTANTSTSLNTAGPDLQLTFRSELTRFDHLSKLRTTGQRLRATPTLSSRYERPYLEVTPRITLDLSHYKLSRNEREQGLPSTISRSLPLISLDTRLFLERSYGDGRFL
ncbi:MAG TPA: LPS-assembly protein LptD, partial [Halothiobacillus sp.]|nr:LPS-assembly protein LptD [Halothiobacillus sp.]